MATFPTYADLLRAGFAQQRGPAVQRTDMESGPPKQLKTKSRVMVSRPVAYLLRTAANYASFITWFQTTINYGADWFDWTDPVDANVKSARIVGGTLQSEEPIEPRMQYWKVSFMIETWSG